jgi:hypothetical protein
VRVSWICGLPYLALNSVRGCAPVRTVTVMKFNKTWGIVVVGAPLTIVSFVVSFKLGIIAVLALLILARVLRGPSESGGVIGVDHKNPPGTRPPQRNGGGIQTFFPPRGGWGQ